MVLEGYTYVNVLCRYDVCMGDVGMHASMYVYMYVYPLNYGSQCVLYTIPY